VEVNHLKTLQFGLNKFEMLIFMEVGMI